MAQVTTPLKKGKGKREDLSVLRKYDDIVVTLSLTSNEHQPISNKPASPNQLDTTSHPQEKQDTMTLEKFTLAEGETKNLPKAKVQTNVHETFKVSKLTMEPGWKWSVDIKPLVGTDSCQVGHSGVIQSGTMTVKMDDGTEKTFKGGDSFYIPPGHDGWVVGDEPMVCYEFAPIAREGNVWNTENKA